MVRDTGSAEVRLPRGAFLRVQNGRDMVLALREGFLWITQPGHCPDVMLSDGQSLRIDDDGLVLVQATEPSRFALSSGGRYRRIALEARGDGPAVEAGPAQGFLGRLKDRIARLRVPDYGVSTWDIGE